MSISYEDVCLSVKFLSFRGFEVSTRSKEEEEEIQTHIHTNIHIHTNNQKKNQYIYIMPFFGFGKKKKKEVTEVTVSSKIEQRDSFGDEDNGPIKRTASQKEVRQVERNVEVLVKGVAKDIQKMRVESVLASKWRDLIPVIERLSNPIEVESTLREKEEDSTLWNTTLISLIQDMKKYEYKTFSDKWVGSEDLPEDFKAQLKDFEVGVGKILHHLANQIEALQSTNVLQFVEHCDFVLQNSLKYSNLIKRKYFHQAQESQCLFYLRSIFRYVDEEEIGSRSIMEHILENKTINTIVTYLNLHNEVLSDPVKIAACEVLSYMFDTDEYLAKRNKYVPSDMRREVLALEDTTLSYLIGKDRSLRRKLRPLLSQIKLLGIPAK